MIVARFRRPIAEDHWVSRVSRSFPDATFRLLSGFVQGDTAVELGECLTDEPRAVADAAMAQPSITAYDQLELTDDRTIAKYETTDTSLYALVERSSLPVEFPVVVRDGWSEFDFTGTRADFDEIRETLERNDRQYELVSVVGSRDSTTVLTDRQREVLDAALREGYFAVPRGCTLAELAATLDVDKATASGVVRRGQARIVRHHLVGSGGDGR